ncbi:hypothetical protein ACTQ4E_15910 [Lawsonibacter sp. LCP25S3_G6]|uniref:hypothetical protein n=1 Tax=unclassified Lawsonibacter TaxID=2617946 RepID=UPI003F9B8A59
MNVNATHQVSSNSRSQKAESSLRPKYLGAWGTLTGALSANPLAYPNRDGSRTYLFRMNVESRTGNLNNDQLNHTATLVAYVPKRKTDCYSALRKGDRITVRYVVQTSYYLDKEGCPTQKTCLSARSVHLLSKKASPAPRQVRPFRPDRQNSALERG